MTPWLLIALMYFCWVFGLLIVKKIVYVYIRKIVKNTASQWDDVLMNAADFPLLLFIFTSGVTMIERVEPGLIDAQNAQFLLGVFKAATILAIALFVERFINGLIKINSDKVDILRTSGVVVKGFVRIVIIVLGVLVLLDSCGISVTPVIASLGIGSLAVALALQPTLENFFAGIQIVVDKPIQVGQVVKLESGEEGVVYEIGWRSTWIRTGPNNMVIIPNKNLINARILNYHYPDRQLAVTVDVGVHYNSDLDQVERVIIDVGRDVMKSVDGGVRDFQPVVRFNQLGDFSVNCTVALRAEDFSDMGLIKHEFIKRVVKRFAREGIVIPYPIQAVDYEQEKAFAKIKEG